MRRSLMFAMLSLVAIVVVGVPAATAQAPSGYALYLPFDDGVDPTNNLAVGNDGFLEPAAGPAFSTDIPLVDGNVKSLSFDGIDDYVTVASYAALEPAGAFTVSLWAKSSNPGTGNRYLIVKGAQGGSAGTYSLYTAGGNLYFDVFDYLNPGYLYAATTPATGVWNGAWHNITGVYTPGAPGSIRLYVDGLLGGSGSASFAPDFSLAEDALTIGDYNPTSGVSTGLYNFTGLMDEVFFYGRALSDWEVKGLADRHAVSSVKVSGPIVAHDLATKLSATDKGEPDYAFEGIIYQGNTTLWGSISINYKNVLGGPVTCVFTAGPTTTLTWLTYNGSVWNLGPATAVPVAQFKNGGLNGTCSDGTLLPNTWLELLPSGAYPLYLPRGGVYIDAPGTTFDLTENTTGVAQAAPGGRAWWTLFDRGNVIFWNAG